MQPNTFREGEKVCVISYSPFRGLKGTIQRVNSIPTVESQTQPHCFYLIELEGTLIQQPIWFDFEEVESISSRESDSIIKKQSNKQNMRYSVSEPNHPSKSRLQ